MTTMVEKVARAIGLSLDESNTPWEKCGSGFKEICTDTARAAIEAMMEPTDGMIQAGVSEDQTDDVYRDVRSIFAVMIQAALKEGQ